MKIFLDTANIEEIKKANSFGIIDGVTTNPTLIAKEKGDFKTIIKEITSIVNGPISAETVSMEADAIIKEGKILSKIHKNIVVKVPFFPEGLKAVKALESEGIKTNVTLIFSPNQALLAAKAGASYVSPFVGRLDDISHVGMDAIRTIVQIYKNYNYKTQVITASIRHPLHVIDAAMAGSHVATIPMKVLDQMMKHPLTDNGIKKFLEDWDTVCKSSKK